MVQYQGLSGGLQLAVAEVIRGLDGVKDLLLSSVMQLLARGLNSLPCGLFHRAAHNIAVASCGEKFGNRNREAIVSSQLKLRTDLQLPLPYFIGHTVHLQYSVGGDYTERE